MGRRRNLWKHKEGRESFPNATAILRQFTQKNILENDQFLRFLKKIEAEVAHPVERQLPKL